MTFSRLAGENFRLFPAFELLPRAGVNLLLGANAAGKTTLLEAVYALRRGLAQMPPQSAMEWLIKRIAATPSNDALLAGLL